jgi:hypothetical protein
MNAFMIFARKRRPEVSAANQMMRTGEISKILSKEWNAMDIVSLALRFVHMNSFLIEVLYTELIVCLFPSPVRKAVLSGSGQTTQGHLQLEIPRLRLPPSP